MYVVRVNRVIRHTPKISTIEFKPAVAAYPGQFVMVNVFNYEEIPLSLSSSNTLTVKAVGETTSALVDMQPGEKLGLRGPFGRPFTPGSRPLIIAGGIGIAPVRFLYHYLQKCGSDVQLIYGAKTREELLFVNEFDNAIFATEDGSFGLESTVVEVLKELDLTHYDRICCCGPEEMMRAVYEMLGDAAVKAEFSLERYMRCGVGVCGSCVLENGLRVCADGPIFRGSELDW